MSYTLVANHWDVLNPVWLGQRLKEDFPTKAGGFTSKCPAGEM